MPETCDALILGGGPAGSTARAPVGPRRLVGRAARTARFPRGKVCGEYLSGTNRPLFAALGLLDFFDDSAGPEVTCVGLFAGDGEIHAQLPEPRHGWGRACRGIGSTPFSWTGPRPPAARRAAERRGIATAQRRSMDLPRLADRLMACADRHRRPRILESRPIADAAATR